MLRAPPPPSGVQRSLERLRKFGKAHARVQKPGEVTVTLRDSLAPELVIVGSPHPTKVADKGGTVICELKAGEGATFRATVTEGKDADGNPTRDVGAWSRQDAPLAYPAPSARPSPKTSPAAS